MIICRVRDLIPSVGRRIKNLKLSVFRCILYLIIFRKNSRAVTVSTKSKDGADSFTIEEVRRYTASIAFAMLKE